jgi:hypothetical protein
MRGLNKKRGECGHILLRLKYFFKNLNNNERVRVEVFLGKDKDSFSSDPAF